MVGPVADHVMQVMRNKSCINFVCILSIRLPEPSVGLFLKQVTNMSKSEPKGAGFPIYVPALASTINRRQNRVDLPGQVRQENLVHKVN